MSDRPYVTLSCAISIDGYLDAAASGRLMMSNAADLDRVDAVRAQHDAIMVGASTVRRDDPRLRVRSAERRAARQSAGRASSPTRVTVTSSGELPASARFFATDDTMPVVYVPAQRARKLAACLGDGVDVVGIADRVRMTDVLADLHERRGVRNLMVEGGGTLLTQFLAENLADELQLVIAPFFVGEARAPRMVGSARFPWTAAHRATLASTEQLGDVVLLRYALSDRAIMSDPVGAAARPLELVAELAR